MAAHRPDIFGDSPGDKEFRRQAEELAKSRAREKDVWDGHAASKESITNRYQATANLDEQIEALHRAKHLVGYVALLSLVPPLFGTALIRMPLVNRPEDGGEPRIGPSAPAVAPQSAPAQPTTLSTGASISAGPQPANSFLSAPQGLPQGGSPLPPSAPANLPPSLPQRPNVNTPGEALPGPRPVPSSEPAAQQSSTRPREDEVEGEPSAKRPKTDEGQVIPEGEWLASHPDPVKVGVQLPDYPAKPAWGCDGQKLELEVPLTLLVGTVRDRIAVRPSLALISASASMLTSHLSQTMVGLPVGKQKFTYNGKILANSTTLAALNLDNGSVLHVSVKEKK